jgi:hypothetical protein
MRRRATVREHRKKFENIKCYELATLCHGRGVYLAHPPYKSMHLDNASVNSTKQNES